MPAVAAAVCPLVLVLAGPPVAADDTAPSGQFVMQVVSPPAAPVRNAGAARLLVSVVTANGGALQTVHGHLSPQDEAVRFPAFDPSSAGARAIIRVANPAGTDVLDPGKGRLEFGADIMVDQLSEAEGAASTDNGNNVMQRGLYGNSSQFKLQVDGPRATCLVKGRAGSVVVKSTTQVQPDRWYRLQCVRDGEDVTLTVTTWQSDGSAVVTRTTRTGPTGDMSPGSSTIPLSVGGKLNKIGRINDEADQFNGLIENAYLDAGTTVKVPSPGDTPVVAKASSLTLHPSRPHPRRGTKVRFHGTLHPALAAAVGARLALAYRAKGEHGFRVLRRTHVRSDHTFRFRKVVVAGRGTFRVTFTGNAELLGSRAKLRYRHRAFR